MNNPNSQKYELAPNTIDKKSLKNEDFREIYDFQTMVKVSKSAKFRKKLRSPLTISKKILVLAKRLRKKDLLIIYIKAQWIIRHFLI